MIRLLGTARNGSDCEGQQPPNLFHVDPLAKPPCQLVTLNSLDSLKSWFCHVTYRTRANIFKCIKSEAVRKDILLK